MEYSENCLVRAPPYGHKMGYSENCLVRPPPYGCKMGYSENCLVRPSPYGRKMGYSEICIVKPSPSVSKMWSFQYRFLKQVFINIENKEHDAIPQNKSYYGCLFSACFQTIPGFVEAKLKSKIKKSEMN